MRAKLLGMAFFLFAIGVSAHSQGLFSPNLITPPAAQFVDSLGRYLEIDRIFIIGNRLTRDQIILRELSLKTGDVIYSTDLDEVIEKDERKLFNTRLFNTVDIRAVELVEGKVDLLIDLDERWYTFPSPIFELSDRNFNEWWQNYNHDFRRVNYGLRLYQYNVRGRNETLRATLQFGFQRVFSVTYRVPYIDRKQKHGIIIEMDFKESKNIAYRTNDHKLQFLRSENLLQESSGAGITYTYRNSFYNRHAFSIDYRKTSITDTVMQLNNNYFGSEQQEQQYISLSYYYTSDHRDIISYPLRGYYLTTRATKAGLGLVNDINKTELILSYAHYFDLRKKFYLSNYTYGYWSTPDQQPYNQFGVLGYKNQVIRGYEIYVIEGPAYFLNKTTFKKQLFARTYRWASGPIEQFRHIPIALYAKVYSDFGYVKNYPNYTNNARLTDRFLISGGAGLDLVSAYDVVLRFEYTFNHEGKGGFFFNLWKEF